jgi:hypothetical protein
MEFFLKTPPSPGIYGKIPGTNLFAGIDGFLDSIGVGSECQRYAGFMVLS